MVAQIVKDELRHATVMYGLLADLGVDVDAHVRAPRRDLHDAHRGRRRHRHRAHHRRQAGQHLLLPDRHLGRLHLLQLLHGPRRRATSSRTCGTCSYGPWVRAIEGIFKEEKFHIRHGEFWVKQLAEDPKTHDEAQATLNKWYIRTMNIFGRPGSPKNALYRKYRLKLRDNDEVRQTFAARGRREGGRGRAHAARVEAGLGPPARRGADPRVSSREPASRHRCWRWWRCAVAAPVEAQSNRQVKVLLEFKQQTQGSRQGVQGQGGIVVQQERRGDPRVRGRGGLAVEDTTTRVTRSSGPLHRGAGRRRRLDHGRAGRAVPAAGLLLRLRDRQGLRRPGGRVAAGGHRARGAPGDPARQQDPGHPDAGDQLLHARGRRARSRSWRRRPS